MSISIEELKKFILDNPKNWYNNIKKNEKMYALFLELTDPAVEYIEDPSLALRKTVLFENIIEPPRCPVCNKLIKKYNQIRFKLFCSMDCFNSEEGKTIRKKRTTDAVFLKYGVKYTGQLYSVKELRKKTMLKKYGVEYTLQSKQLKEKVKQTYLENYGVDHPSKAEEIKEKKRKTCLKNYGVEIPIQSEEVKNKIKETNLKKYGVEHPIQSDEIKEKMKETMVERYGVENASQSEEIKEKRKDTMVERYGVENASQSEDLKVKRKKTMLERHGVEHPAQSEEIKGKIKETCLAKYGTECYFQSPQVRTINLEKLKIHMKEKNLQPLFTDEEYIYSQLNDELKYKCLTCNNEYSVINNPSTDKGIYYYNFLCTCSRYRSKYELELAEFLNSINIPFQNNDKSISNKFELDLYIPEHNLGIEYHGLYWHCEDNKSSSYHQEKYLFFKEHNIDVIQIFGNEWSWKRHIVESIIKRRLGKSDYVLSSEETEIKTPSYQDYLQFLEENSLHSIPNTTPTQILGLYHNDTLVQLLALNNSDILSYTTKLDYSITNGLHKLLSTTNRNLNITLDLRYSTGQEFIDYGFSITKITEPNCLHTDLKNVHQTEADNTHKIYDCGSLILTYKLYNIID